MKHNDERGTEVTVPHLAESLVSATVGKWLKQPGDEVREFDVLCELMTDKVNVEMPSPIEGTLIRILVEEGRSAAVGEPICIIREPSESAETDRSSRFSPAVLRLAKELRVDLSQVVGTGLGGRITRKDVSIYVKNREDAGPVEPTQQPESTLSEHSVSAAKAETGKPDAAAQEQDHILAATAMRSMIASRMRQSVAEIPHAWIMVEADVSSLVALRQKLKDRFLSKEGVRLTYTPFVLKAIVNAIKDFPMLNSTWASDQIIVKKDINLCIAVGSEDSVITPVVRNADRKTIAGLAIELDDLVKRARAGKLTLSDMQGGTFTFNNTGAFGSVLSYPIINYPQAAIMTFESIVRRPVVIHEDAIAIRSVANLCLSLDHRILDGMICGRFLQRVKHYLEQYDQETVIY